MNFTLQLGPHAIPITAEKVTAHAEGHLLHGEQVALDLPFTPGSYYRHGWQSWSLTTWQQPDQVIPESRPALLHPMQVVARYARDPRPNGSWLGAVGAPGDQVLLLGALGLETHVALEGRRLSGWCETGPADWFVTLAPETEAFTRYAAQLGAWLGTPRASSPPRVWSSWYSLYSAIDEPILQRQLNALKGMPFDVFQVDDGWQVNLGDWEPNARFPTGMAALAGRIRAAGFVPGLWLAPLLVAPSAQLYRQHPDWLLRAAGGGLVSAGFLKGEPLYTLDSSHPAVLGWLASLMHKVRGWGFAYLKLDFLYAGALDGAHQRGVGRETAYRGMLSVLRGALDDAYFLTCGAPVIPSLGLCDSLRAGPDVAAHWNSRRDSQMLTNYAIPGTQNALRTTLHRLWLAPLVHIDPDAVYFRSQRCQLTAEQKRLLQDMALITGCKSTSDLPAWLTGAERSELLAFLQAQPQVERLGRGQFRLDGRLVDFAPLVPLQAPLGLSGALVRWAANQPAGMRIHDWMEHRNQQKVRDNEG